MWRDCDSRDNDGRSLYGERGLKYTLLFAFRPPCWCRSLYGERGLKYMLLPARLPAPASLPLRGAWIEIVDMLTT